MWPVSVQCPVPSPLGKNWGLVWAEGRDEGGGVEVELVVDLASGAKVTSGKREKDEEKKNSQDPPREVQHSCHDPSSCRQQKKTERKKIGEICFSLCS